MLDKKTAHEIARIMIADGFAKDAEEAVSWDQHSFQVASSEYANSCFGLARWVAIADGELPSVKEFTHYHSCSRCQSTWELLGLLEYTKERDSTLNTNVFAREMLKPETLSFSPVADLAAAIEIIASASCVFGIVQLINSPLGADLAIRLISDRDQALLPRDAAVQVSLDGYTQKFVVFVNESSVFCEIFQSDLVGGTQLGTVEALFYHEISDRNLDDLVWSYENLSHDVSSRFYEHFISKAKL